MAARWFAQFWASDASWGSALSGARTVRCPIPVHGVDDVGQRGCGSGQRVAVVSVVGAAVVVTGACVVVDGVEWP